MSYLIQLQPTATSARRERWHQIFGSNQIPVKFHRPHETCTPDGRVHLVYDVDIAALDETAVRRLANFMAAHTWKLPFEQALANLTTYGYQVSAIDVELVIAEAEETDSSASFLPYPIVSHSPNRRWLTPESTKRRPVLPLAV